MCLPIPPNAMARAGRSIGDVNLKQAAHALAGEHGRCLLVMPLSCASGASPVRASSRRSPSPSADFLTAPCPVPDRTTWRQLLVWRVGTFQRSSAEQSGRECAAQPIGAAASEARSLQALPARLRTLCASRRAVGTARRGTLLKGISPVALEVRDGID